jgi:hypothetical protein
MKNKSLFRGILLLIIGAFIIYWAQAHSPNADFGKLISNELSGSYTMSKGWYYFSFFVGVLLTLTGLARSYKALK